MGGGGGWCFFVRIRRPPRSTLDRSAAASDVYKRQVVDNALGQTAREIATRFDFKGTGATIEWKGAVSYTHLRAHETVLELVCRLLLEKKNHYI